MTAKPQFIPLTTPSILKSDGWGNVFSMIGIPGRDKGASSSFFRVGRLTRALLEDMYRDDPIAGRIIDVPADDATREWWELKVTTTDEDGDGITLDDAQRIADQVQQEMQRLRVPTLLNKALKWEALYGGAAILMGIDDGIEDPFEPVGENIRGVRWLQVLHAEQITPGPVVTDVDSERFGQPEYYVIDDTTDTNTQFRKWHWSRVMAFHGIQIPDDIQDQNNGWGDPVLRRNFEPLSHFWIAQKGTATLAQEWGTVIYGIEDLARILESENGNKLIQRMQVNQRMRSMVNAHLIDAESESLSRDTPGVAGLSDIMHRQELALTASSGMPAVKLFGVPPSGFTTTDENALINWNAVVGSKQENNVTPELRRLVDYTMRAGDSPVSAVPETWRIAWNPLTKPSQREALELRKLAAEADAINIDRGVYSPDEAATRYTGDEFQTDVTLDVETRSEEAEAEGEDDGTAAEIQAELEAPVPSEEVKPADQALNGAQIKSMMDIVAAVVEGTLPRDSAVAILQRSFLLDKPEAEAIVGSAENPDESEAPPAEPTVPGAAPMAPEMVENATAMQEAFGGDGDGDDGDSDSEDDEA